MLRTTGILAALVCCYALSATQSIAGPLFNHPDALPGWTGSVAYDGSLSIPPNPALTGTIEYAVFTAGNFNANFSGLGYVPGDAVVYTYQLLNTGSDAVSTEIVGILNAANTIGTFDIGDVDATSAAFVLGNAQWSFSPEIGQNESSWGLAFSSPNLPQSGLGIVVDGGSTALQVGIPTPSDVPIPEPSTAALVGLAWVGISVLRNRRTR